MCMQKEALLSQKPTQGIRFSSIRRFHSLFSCMLARKLLTNILNSSRESHNYFNSFMVAVLVFLEKRCCACPVENTLCDLNQNNEQCHELQFKLYSGGHILLTWNI